MITFPGLPPVDRALFIPDDIWVPRPIPYEKWPQHLRDTLPPDAVLTERVQVSRAADPREWERWVATDEALVTAVKDDMWPVSSSSAPWLMAEMIAALDVKPDMRVLEVGTGTGWNAACLAALGAIVTTVEIDAQLADHATQAIKRAGYSDTVTVVLGDGEAGSPDHAPYDRVIATAAVHTVPYAWVEQTRNGGRIVAPYTGPHHPGGLMVLDVHNGVAVGSIAGEAAFMPMRGQRLSQVELQAIGEPAEGLRVEVSEGGQRVWAD